ncbi:MAG: PhoH family protein, partial [Mucilaginibacter sp.]|nr:PhoH family protein [Mucilaginibacter sp.]
MNELKISIENINPAVLWGPNNDHFEIIKKQYPKLKIVARGSEVKVLGDERELVIFEEKFNHLIQHIEKFENLNITDLERVLGSKVDINAPADAAADKFASGEVIVFGPNGVMVKARTANQRKMVDCINKSDILFAIGPAGTGKTYTAVALAVRALKNKEIKRIILTRPAVEAGENLGFLPGDLKEKIDPYLR